MGEMVYIFHDFNTFQQKYLIKRKEAKKRVIFIKKDLREVFDFF